MQTHSLYDESGWVFFFMGENSLRYKTSLDERVVSMKIIKAMPADNYCVTICFDNKQSVTLDMKGKLNAIRFSGLRSESVFRAAQTDGKSLHWPGGISMAVSEIIELVSKQTDVK